MACSSCSGTDGVSKGCGNKGHCSSGSCNKLNTFDWLAKREMPIAAGNNIVEISFKNGARKGFFFMEHTMEAITGDMVVVNSGNGYDVGRLSLSGDLVSLQMKKKRVAKERVEFSVIRKANQRDLEKLQEARDIEIPTMIKARAIARTLDIDLKMGDVEYQGDKRKATFYYTAEGRVDFRDLVRAYAKEFKIKVEMRQIGSRQESARIGGIGSCGRELCCSTWLTDFKSVSTTAARYQYMAINQSKLSGQCGRLKCCLNYELDNYVDALAGFPEKADYLKTADGSAKLMKIDIFKGIMYYSMSSKKGRGPILPMDKEDVKKVIAMNKKGELPDSMLALQQMAVVEKVEDFQDYEDVTGAIELPSKGKAKRSSRSKSSRSRKPGAKSGAKPGTGKKPNGPAKPKQTSNKPADGAAKEGGPKAKKPNSRNKRRRPNNRNRNNKPGDKKPDNTGGPKPE